MLSSRFPRARRSFRVSTTGTKPTCAALSYSNIASSAIMGVGRGLLLWLLGVPCRSSFCWLCSGIVKGSSWQGDIHGARPRTCGAQCESASTERSSAAKAAGAARSRAANRQLRSGSQKLARRARRSQNGAGSDRPGRGCQRPITHEAAAAYFSSGLEPLTAWRTTNCREA